MSRVAPAPRPDPFTGEPRPPRAPVEASWVEAWRDSTRRPRHRRLPPVEEGPMLEWYRAGRRMLLLAVAVGFGVPFSLLLVNWASTGEGWAYFTEVERPGWFAFMLSMPVVGALLLYNHGKREFVAAGAGWVGTRHGWVRTYELIWVGIQVDAAPHLYLVDSDHRAIRPRLTTIQQNRDLWDLVYNGILHSIHERHVHTDVISRRILELHGPAMLNELRIEREGIRPGEFVIVDRPRWWRRAPRRYRRGRRR